MHIWHSHMKDMAFSHEGYTDIIAEILLLCDIWWIVIFEVPLHNGGHVDAHGGWTFILCFHFLWKHLAAENLFYGPSHIKATSKEWCKLKMLWHFTIINLLPYESYGTSDFWVTAVQETLFSECFFIKRDKRKSFERKLSQFTWQRNNRFWPSRVFEQCLQDKAWRSARGSNFSVTW